jgi:hypothetical protein
LFINTTGNPIYDGIKQEFYFYYLLCGGALLVIRPRYILLFIPLIAKKMFNDDPIRWSNELYYSIEFVSILPIVVFLIISEFHSKMLRYVVTGFVCLSTIVLTIHYLDNFNRKLNWWGDQKYAFYKPSMYKADVNVGKINKYLKSIPDDASVSASGHLLPHLAFRQKIYYFPRVDDAEYLVLFMKDDLYPLNAVQFEDEANKYLKTSKWQFLVYDYPFIIAHRKNVAFNGSSSPR